MNFFFLIFSCTPLNFPYLFLSDGAVQRIFLQHEQEEHADCIILMMALSQSQQFSCSCIKEAQIDKAFSENRKTEHIRVGYTDCIAWVDISTKQIMPFLPVYGLANLIPSDIMNYSNDSHFSGKSLSASGNDVFFCISSSLFFFVPSRKTSWTSSCLSPSIQPQLVTAVQDSDQSYVYRN